MCFPGRHSVYWEQAVGMARPLIVKRWEGTAHVDVCGNVHFLDEESDIAIAEALSEVLGRRGDYINAAARAAPSFLYSSIARRSIELETEAKC